MATKPANDAFHDTQEDGSGNFFDNELAQSMKTSAQQLWQAGLGAFTKAQEEGGKLLEQRIAQVLQRMGVPTQAEVAALREQVDQLQQQVTALQEQLGTGSRGTTARKARAARKAAQSKGTSPGVRKRGGARKAAAEAENISPDSADSISA